MTNATRNEIKPGLLGRNGADASESDAKRAQQVASGLALAPRDTLTTKQGLRVSDHQNSARAGVCGPTLLEERILRERVK